MRSKHAVFLTVIPLGLVFCLNACVTKTLTFDADKGATVSLLSVDKLNEDGTVLGEAPLTVELEKMRGKVVKISQKGRYPVFWVVTDAAGKETVATIKLPIDSGSGLSSNEDGKGDPKAATNRLMRLLMRSYQALSGRRFKDARDLADQAGTIDPEIAAPLVIKGLAFFQEGNPAEAKAALIKAKALDPEDKDIDTMLKMVR